MLPLTGGPGVEKPLLSRLAAMKHGRFTYIESPEAIEQRVGHLFDEVESPAMVGITIEARGGTLLRTYPRTLPDLSAGDDLLVTSRVMGAPGSTVELIVHGLLGGKQMAFQTAVKLPERSAHAWAGRLWAKARIDDLLEEQALVGASAELQTEIVELGLAYNLVTPFTSFLAVPERELNAAQSATLAGMRESRKAVMAANSDAAALSRTQMPPGDPVLTVKAPRDALQVTAWFAFGLVKDLVWDEAQEKWTLRFLVPRGVPDGDYEAQVIIVRRDGTVELAKAAYTIDSQEPEFEVEATRVAGGVQLRVVSSEPARRVSVALLGDRRRRLELAGDGRTFAGFFPGAEGAGKLRVVVADTARNETSRDVLPR